MSTKIAEVLLPPANGDSSTNRWRWKVWATLMGIISVLSFHIAAEKGLIVGIDGVAHNQDVKRIEDRFSDLEAKQDVALRLQLAAEICRVWRQRNVDDTGRVTRQILDASLERLQEQYAAVNNGVRYSTVECSRGGDRE